MFKVKEEVKTNGFVLKGSMPDVLSQLESEQKCCGRITMATFLRKKKLEKTISDQLNSLNFNKQYSGLM